MHSYASNNGFNCISYISICTSTIQTTTVTVTVCSCKRKLWRSLHTSLKDTKANKFIGDVWCLDISFFHHYCVAQGVKQNNLVPLVVFLLIWDFGTCVLWEEITNFQLYLKNTLQYRTKRTGLQIAFANVGGTVTLEDYNENK